ncbi:MULTISPECIES: DUF1353 domain-containing protein [Pantoea]|uniref:DUF1353 domain-containing protein n=1 Tax=Pantoea TaxID=53335 RepID=UPI0028AFA78C|nr:MULTISPECIES: DUF1353 domain-containing protein [Pantoea]MDU4129521.1 DUF1353 domain-containing protein [Pantoea sp.]
MNKNGFFSGEIITHWLTDQTPNRNMQLVDGYSYRDPDEKDWVAPKGSIINGASIPQALWDVVGSPYIGNYRNASVIHDVACDQAKTKEDRKKADIMFYYACLAGNYPKFQARVFYVAVRIGAWIDASNMIVTDTTFDESFFKPEIKTNNPSDADLRNILKDIGTAVYDLPDDTTSETLDSVIDPKLTFYMNSYN